MEKTAPPRSFTPLSVYTFSTTNLIPVFVPACCRRLLRAQWTQWYCCVCVCAWMVTAGKRHFWTMGGVGVKLSPSSSSRNERPFRRRVMTTEFSDLIKRRTWRQRLNSIVPLGGVFFSRFFFFLWSPPDNYYCAVRYYHVSSSSSNVPFYGDLSKRLFRAFLCRCFYEYRISFLMTFFIRFVKFRYKIQNGSNIVSSITIASR